MTINPAASIGVFYRTGLIERWGRGTNRVAEMCREAGVPAPEFSSQGPATVVTFRANVAGEVAGEVKRLIAVLKTPMKRQEIQSALNLRHEDHFREAYLTPALKAALVEMTIPGKPRSRLQKYRLSLAGRKILEQIEAEASAEPTDKPRKKR